MGVCRNYRLRHSPLFFVWPFLSIMSKTAIQYLRSKAMSKTLPPPSDDTKVRYAKGRWRELALFGGNERSNEARLSLHIRSMYIGVALKGGFIRRPETVKTLRMRFSGYINGVQWLPQRPSVAISTVFSGYLNSLQWLSQCF